MMEVDYVASRQVQCHRNCVAQNFLDELFDDTFVAAVSRERSVRLQPARVMPGEAPKRAAVRARPYCESSSAWVDIVQVGNDAERERVRIDVTAVLWSPLPLRVDRLGMGPANDGAQVLPTGHATTAELRTVHRRRLR
jgi:hypothetical protein